MESDHLDVTLEPRPEFGSPMWLEAALLKSRKDIETHLGNEAHQDLASLASYWMSVASFLVGRLASRPT